MKQFVFILISTCILTAISHAQSAIESFEATKGTWELPLSGTFRIDSMVENRLGFIDSLSLTLKSKSTTEVSSIEKGVVLATVQIAGDYTIIVNVRDYILAYTGLEKPLVKKGDMLVKGTILGRLAKDETEGTYNLTLMLIKGTEKLNINRWFNWKTAHNTGENCTIYSLPSAL